MLPGVSVTYQGEELGMTNTNISWEDTLDPAGLACGPDRYQFCSRDPERTPMHDCHERVMEDHGGPWRVHEGHL